MELRGALKFLGFFLSLQTTGDVAERCVGGKCFGGDRILWFRRADRSGLIFPGFDLRAIFWRKDVVAVQIFGGVNVFGFFLLVFLFLSLVFVFAGAFLASGFGDVLVLSEGRRGADNGNRENQNAGNKETQVAGERPYGCRAANRGWGVKIRNYHGKPTTYGGTPLKGKYTKNGIG